MNLQIKHTQPICPACGIQDPMALDVCLKYAISYTYSSIFLPQITKLVVDSRLGL